MTAKNKRSAKSKKRSRRHPVRQLIGRLVLLAVVVFVILAVGHYTFGWQPLGKKTSRLDGRTPGAQAPESTEGLDAKIKSVVDKIKQEVGGSEPLAAQTPGTQATPTPTPDEKSKTDKEKLSEFLQKQMD